MTRIPGLVSVILPALNAEAHLREALQTALNQTYRDIEVIVVDDGSSDGSAAIVDEVARSDHRVRLLRQRNAGVAAARNKAIADARGEFIAPLDADDIWDKTKIERHVRRMSECGPSAGLSYSWWAWIDLQGIVLDVSPRWMIEGHMSETLIEVNFTGNASVPMFRAACLDEVGAYDVTLRERGGEGCEDWDLAVRVAERFGVCVVPRILVGYRRRADGMSTAYAMMQHSHVLVLEAAHRRYPGLATDVSNRSIDQLALHLAGVSFWSGEYRRALRLGVQALRSRVGVGVLRYLPRVFMRRIIGGGRISPVSTVGGDFAEASFPEALLPYDRIYAKRLSNVTKGRTTS